MNTETEKSTELVAVETAVTSMNKLTAGLEDLAKRFKGVVYDVTTPNGMAEAKAARKEIAAPRIEVEKIRKAAKAPILELGRKLDAEAKRITEELLRLENPIDEQIKAEENRIEAERQAKIKAEQDRIAKHTGRIDDIRGAVHGAARVRTAADVERIMQDIDGIVIDASWEEFRDAAADAKAETYGALQKIHEAAIAREAEDARLKMERQELERLRAEQAERDRKAREREAAERARVDGIRERLNELRGCRTLTPASGSKLIAEHLADLQKLPTDGAIFQEFVQQAVDAKASGIAHLESLLKAAQEFEAEQERQAEERARIEREAAELAERQRIEREEREARECAEREETERKAREAEELRRKNYRPTLDEMTAVLADHYQRDAQTVEGWLREAFGTKAKKAAA